MADLGALRQLGLVTRDIDASIAFYLSAGIGPWHLARSLSPEYLYRGEPSQPLLSVAVASTATVQLELIQQRCDTRSIYREWLAGTADREKLHHLSFWAEGHAGRVDAAVAEGYVLEVVGGGGGGFCYLRHPGQPHVLVELIELRPERDAAWRRMAATAAAWDGSEPVRELVPPTATRSGSGPAAG